MNQYEWFLQEPSLAFWYAGFLLFLSAWLFISIRAQWRWLVDIAETRKEWRGQLPDWRRSKEIALFLVTWGINLILLGLFVHISLV